VCKKSCPLVHSMHGSSGLPDELKSHAVGHPWSSLLVSISWSPRSRNNMPNEQLFGFFSLEGQPCVYVVFSRQLAAFQDCSVSVQIPIHEHTTSIVAGPCSCVVCQAGKMLRSFHNRWPPTFMPVGMVSSLAKYYSSLLERPNN